MIDLFNIIIPISVNCWWDSAQMEHFSPPVKWSCQVHLHPLSKCAFESVDGVNMELLEAINHDLCGGHGSKRIFNSQIMHIKYTPWQYLMIIRHHLITVRTTVNIKHHVFPLFTHLIWISLLVSYLNTALHNMLFFN